MKKIGFIGALLASTALAACGGGGAETDSEAQANDAANASGAEMASETTEASANESMTAESETMAEDAASDAEEASSDAMAEAGDDAEAAAETDAAEETGETEQASADASGGAADDGMITVAGLTGDPGAGRRIFVRCQTCHALDEGVHKNGPSLYGIFGREAGSVEGYGRYSDANANSGITWSHQTMFEYLENPRAYIPGTHMAFPGLPREQDRADVIAYIEENGGGAE